MSACSRATALTTLKLSIALIVMRMFGRVCWNSAIAGGSRLSASVGVAAIWIVLG
jgi:hypothetical protein